jgi:hypothetical protein
VLVPVLHYKLKPEDSLPKELIAYQKKKTAPNSPGPRRPKVPLRSKQRLTIDLYPQ